jgi:hypothetical protein
VQLSPPTHTHSHLTNALALMGGQQQVLLTDFFGSVLPVQTTSRGYPLGE